MGSIYTVRCIVKLMKEGKGECTMVTKKNESAKPGGRSCLEGKDFTIFLKLGD